MALAYLRDLSSDGHSLYLTLTVHGAENSEDFQKLMGINLRSLRREAGLSQRDLARKLDLSHQQIQKYEKGINALPLERVRSFAQALGVTPTGLAFPDLDSTSDKLSSDQSDLLRIYDNIPDHHSRLLLLDLVRSVGALARNLSRPHPARAETQRRSRKLTPSQTVQPPPG